MAVGGAVRAPGVVLFAHGSGSSRRSPRNQMSPVLRDAGIGTLLFDLLTQDEEQEDLSLEHCASTSNCWRSVCWARPSGWKNQPKHAV